MIYYLLYIIYHLLFIIYHLLFIIYYLLFIENNYYYGYIYIKKSDTLPKEEEIGWRHLTPWRGRDTKSSCTLILTCEGETMSSYPYK